MWSEDLARRPLIALTVAYIGGLCVGLSPWAWVAVLFSLFLTGNWGVRALAIGLAVIGFVQAPRPAVYRTAAFSAIADTLEVRSVPQPRKDGYFTKVEVRGQKLLWFSPYDKTPEEIYLGDRWFVRGRIGPPPEQAKFRFEEGFVTTVQRAEKMSSGPRIAQLSTQMNRHFTALALELLPEREARWVNAICFNADYHLHPFDIEILGRTGLIHIVSTSGMHVLLVSGALALLLRGIPVPRSVQLAVLFTLLSVYALAAGLNPPIIRSVLMAMFFAPAYLFERESDALSTLCASAICTLLVLPNSVYDVGFQMSFSTVLALALFVRAPGTARRQWKEALSTSTRSSVVAALGVAPWLLHYLGRLSLISPVSTLTSAPLVPLIAISALGFGAVAPLVPGVAAVGYTWVVLPATRALIWLTETLAALPFASFDTFQLPGMAALGITAAMLLFWRAERRPAV